MGTRADFYVGKGKDAEWIGSIAWDGYRDGIDAAILKAKTPRAFRAAVAKFFKTRDDVTLPKMGWPWPWDDSGTSDCSYWFFAGKCWDAHGSYMAGGGSVDHDVYLPCTVPERRYQDEDGYFIPAKHAKLTPVEYPDMSAKKNVTMGQRSGLIVLTAVS